MEGSVHVGARVIGRGSVIFHLWNFLFTPHLEHIASSGLKLTLDFWVLILSLVIGPFNEAVVQVFYAELKVNVGGEFVQENGYKIVNK